MKEEWSSYVASLSESLIHLEDTLDKIQVFEKDYVEFDLWISAMELCPNFEVRSHFTLTGMMCCYHAWFFFTAKSYFASHMCHFMQS